MRVHALVQESNSGSNGLVTDLDLAGRAMEELKVIQGRQAALALMRASKEAEADGWEAMPPVFWQHRKQ